MDYLLDKAVAGSDLRRAQALSQDDPSLLWLAMEIIGVGLDAATVVHAWKTLRPVVRAAQADRQGRADHGAAPQPASRTAAQAVP